MTAEEQDALHAYGAALVRAGSMLRADDPAEAVREVIDLLAALVGYCERARVEGPALDDARAVLARIYPKKEV